MDVVVLADTHLRQGWEPVSPVVRRAVERADVVLHAGDLVSAAALSELQQAANTVAVLGNNDLELGAQLPETCQVVLGGVTVAMVHDSGPTRGRAGRLRRRFPDADVVVFGHSHVPVNEIGLDGQLLFNPGSPTQRRSQPHRSFGRLSLVDGRVTAATIEAL